MIETVNAQGGIAGVPVSATYVDEAQGYLAFCARLLNFHYAPDGGGEQTSRMVRTVHGNYGLRYH
jgi:hypothetical protein